MQATQIIGSSHKHATKWECWGYPQVPSPCGACIISPYLSSLVKTQWSLSTLSTECPRTRHQTGWRDWTASLFSGLSWGSFWKMTALTQGEINCSKRATLGIHAYCKISTTRQNKLRIHRFCPSIEQSQRKLVRKRPSGIGILTYPPEVIVLIVTIWSKGPICSSGPPKSYFFVF